MTNIELTQEPINCEVASNQSGALVDIPFPDASTGTSSGVHFTGDVPEEGKTQRTTAREICELEQDIDALRRQLEGLELSHHVLELSSSNESVQRSLKYLEPYLTGRAGLAKKRIKKEAKVGAALHQMTDVVLDDCQRDGVFSDYRIAYALLFAVQRQFPNDEQVQVADGAIQALCDRFIV